MKTIIKNLLAVCIVMSVLSSCMEPRYYRVHHEHSPRYVERHRVEVRM